MPSDLFGFDAPHGEASSLNRLAGDHPVSTDPRELDAVRRAGDTSMAEFPYYVRRYGDRARLFSLSDGAWLVTLCTNPDPAFVRGEVVWLAHLLSARGMPSYLLERHLDVLEAALAEGVPENAALYARLGPAAHFLRTTRLRRIPEPDFRRMASSFERHADPDAKHRLPRMGEILVAAVADEAGGAGKAVSSVVEWAADPGLFGPVWCDAVRHTIEEARAMVRD